MTTILSSLVAPRAVDTATCGAASDNKVGLMTAALKTRSRHSTNFVITGIIVESVKTTSI